MQRAHKLFLIKDLGLSEKKLRGAPFLGPVRGQRALYPTLDAHSRFKDLDTLRQAVSALPCLQIEVPTMERAGHLSPRDDTVTEESALMRTDAIQHPHRALVMEDSELAPVALHRSPGPIRR